jgi:hypothetical protein
MYEGFVWFSFLFLSFSFSFFKKMATLSPRYEELFFFKNRHI